MDRIRLRMLGGALLSGALLSGIVAATAQAEVKLPVPATLRPPLSSPGESLSITASEKIIPALGPPTSLRL